MAGTRRLAHHPPDLEAKPHKSVPADLAVDLWIRNPQSILSTALAEGVRQFTWRRGVIEKRKMNITSHMRKACAGFDVKYMLIGDEGTAEYNLVTPYTQPLAVYPTWRWGDDQDDLLYMIQHNVGDNKDLTENEYIPPQVRPVAGQKHRIIISNLPPAHTAEGKHAILLLDMLQTTYPKCELFISGPSSLAVLFGHSFRAVDFDPAWSSGGDILILPSGAKVQRPELYPLYERWIELVGFKLSDIVTRQGRIHFALRSARWASRRWKYDYAVDKVYSPTLMETMTPTALFKPPPAKKQRKDFKNKDNARIAALAAGVTNTRADMMLCNQCIFQVSCTTYRADSICIRKGSEFVGFADQFGTRDPDKIIGGLTELLKKQADRTETAMENEEISGDVNPDVTKQINALFKNSQTLIKLLDPERHGSGTKVNVLVGDGGKAAIQAVSFSNPKELTAAAVKALEAYGVPREKITTEMLTGLLKSMASGTPREAIEGTVIKYEEGKAA